MSEATPPPPATPLQRGMDLLSNAAIAVAVVALLGLVVVQGWQVFARYVINDSPSWTEPVTLLLLATAMSLGAACGVHTNRHFGFFLLHAYLGPGLRRAVDVLVQLVVARAVAGGKQVAPARPRGVADNRRIGVLAGHDDLHLDPALEGRCERLSAQLVGDEIGTRQVDRMLRRRDRQQVHQVHALAAA